MQKKITSKSFGYVERPSSEVYSIKIKEGRFKGVIYSYGKVDLKENKENDQLELNFKFIIHEANNRYDTETLNDSRRFTNSNCNVDLDGSELSFVIKSNIRL